MTTSCYYNIKENENVMEKYGRKKLNSLYEEKMGLNKWMHFIIVHLVCS